MVVTGSLSGMGIVIGFGMGSVVTRENGVIVSSAESSDCRMRKGFVPAIMVHFAVTLVLVKVWSSHGGRILFRSIMIKARSGQSASCNQNQHAMFRFIH